MIRDNSDQLNSVRQIIAMSGLTALQGSTSDISVANPIRIDFIIESNEILASYLQGGLRGTLSPAKQAALVKASMTLRDKNRASWWLDHRDSDTKSLLEELSSQ